jgi:nucleotide-binding universal stress UspA family protein
MARGLLRDVRLTSVPYRRPIAAVDLSDLSRRGVELALRIVDPAVATIDCVHAVDLAHASRLHRGGMSASEIEDYVAATEQSARTRLDGWIPSASCLMVRVL